TLAKIRFKVKNRKRVWSQSGIQDLVTITVPKQNEHIYTNGLSEDEVTSRLSALASTIDSRGWAIKNVNINLSPHQVVPTNQPASDRLVGAMPAQNTGAFNNVNSSNLDVKASDDILDEQHNPIAQNFERLINASTSAHRQSIVDNIKQVALSGQLPPNAEPAPAQQYQFAQDNSANDAWFLNPPEDPALANTNYMRFDSQLVAPGGNTLPAVSATPTADEQALVEKFKSANALPAMAYSHLHTIQPLSAQVPQVMPPPQYPVVDAALNPGIAAPVAGKTNQQLSQEAEQAAAQNANADIMNFARNNDLDVATISRQANRKKRKVTDEVVITLH
ncbi:MAG: hypothetical protein ACREGF_00765, partial [Candidatus Saccharimonadales bacterium]